MNIQRFTLCLATALAGCRGEVWYNAHPDNAWLGTHYDNHTIEVGLIDYDATMAQARKADAESGRSLLRLTTPIGDVNSAPIEYWYAVQGGQVVSYQSLGHADGPCCALVSEATSKFEVLPGVTHATFHAGVANFVCDPAKGCKHTGALTKLVFALRELEKDPRCEGQLFGKKVALSDLQYGVFRAHESARLACNVANASDTMTAIWSDSTSAPAIVPLQDRRGNEVFVDIPLAMFELPPELAEHLTPDDVTRATKVIREWIQYLDRLIFLTQHLGPKPTQIYNGGEVRPQVANADSITLSAHIADQNRIARALLYWENNWLKIIDLDNDMFEVALLTDVEKRETIKKVRYNSKLLEDTIQTNEKVLEYLETHYEGDVGYTYIDYDVEENPWNEVIEDAKVAREQLKKDLAWLEEMGSTLIKLSDARPFLIDSALRGWPAPMSEPNWEQQFDAWQAQVAGEIWETIERQLEYRFSFRDARARLLLSNLYFDVTLVGDRVRLTPNYVLSAGYLTICEPDRGFAYYQSTSADQNLAADWGEI